MKPWWPTAVFLSITTLMWPESPAFGAPQAAAPEKQAAPEKNAPSKGQQEPTPQASAETPSSTPATPSNTEPTEPANTDTAPPAPIRNPPLRLEIPRSKALAKQIKQWEGAEGDVLWLGEESDPFLALSIPNYGGETQGSVLILPDLGQNPDWPGVLRKLRTQLPKHGWTTLSISLPDLGPIIPDLLPLPPPSIPTPTAPSPVAAENADQQTENPEPASAPENASATPETTDGKKGAAQKETAQKDAAPNQADAAPEKTKTAPVKSEAVEEKAEATKGSPESAPENPEAASGNTDTSTAQPAPPPRQDFRQSGSEIDPKIYPEEVARRIEIAAAAPTDGDANPKHIVVIAFGKSAGLVAHIAKDLPIPTLAGIVLINPEPYPDASFDFPQDVAALSAPVLDIVPQMLPASNPLLRKQAMGRAQANQNAPVKHYEMRVITGASRHFAGYEPFITKGVRQWMAQQTQNRPQMQQIPAAKPVPQNVPPPPRPTPPPDPPPTTQKLPAPDLNAPIVAPSAPQTKG
ncbi:Hypothetical protein HDN1F_20920 [gamma proteobacterium HdN1]|nr:Hypothetical protein HDN1F_20920 [gamma proteobacterium HdN1]